MLTVYACNSEVENYMYGICTLCSGAKTVEVLLQKELDVTVENFVSEIAELTHHYYTAKQQESKENLQSDQCIILADFSGN
jgi:hypothetical protein